MGEKTRVESDPSLARPHDNGAIIELVQPAIHKLGMLYIKHPIYWTFHARLADTAYRRLKKYTNRVLAVEPGTGNVRQISNEQLIPKIYKATFDLVVHLYLTFEYFTLFTLTSVYLYPDSSTEERHIFNSLEPLELKRKLHHLIVEVFKKPELLTSKGYSMLFQELEQVRHSLNHPKNENTYNCGETTWDKVPIAWGISGKSLLFYKEISKLFNTLYKEWKIIEKRYSRPATLTGVKRGLKSLHTSFIKKNRSKHITNID